MLSTFERITQVRNIYKFIVDPSIGFDSMEMEEVVINDTHVAVRKEQCARCGKGTRFKTDTKGFCSDCKVELGLKPGKLSQLQEDRAFDRGRANGGAALANGEALVQIRTNEVIVPATFVEYAWSALPAEKREAILARVWKVTPLAERAKYISESLSDGNVSTEASGQREVSAS